MNSENDITGVVVVYNTKDLIERAIKSIRKFHPTMKIIIVDGSDEKNPCYEYVCGLADDFTRVFHTDNNIGHGRGLCVAIEYVDTPYILVFDSDIEMLKSPVQEMLNMMENDTYGVGYTEKTALDGYEYGCKPAHKGQPWMRYLHPYFCLIQLKEYKKYAPFCHHGAPAVNTMLDIYSKGLNERVIKEFPGLGHSSGKGWVWEGQPREFIRHDTYGTRGVRVKNRQPEIEGVWDKVIKVNATYQNPAEVDPSQHGSITCITCTGDRPIAFELSKRWIENQTVPPTQWIIIDDGATPIQKPDLSFVTYIRREPKSTDPKHTMILNLKEALPHITGEKIVIWEDDEYYAPTYLEEMSRHLDRYEVVGIGRNRYYHVTMGTNYAHGNMGHASLAQTSFRKTFLPDLNRVIDGDSFLDIRLWNLIFPGETCKEKPGVMESESPNKRGYIFEDTKYIYVGMKGLPGRKGIGSGHKGMGARDVNNTVLRKWVLKADDCEIYIKLRQNTSGIQATTNTRPSLPRRGITRQVSIVK